MNIKLPFLCLALLTTVLVKAQNQSPYGTCGTGIPSQQWEAWFSGEVEKYKENHKNSQAKMVNYTIPVIVHVIHFGEAVGTYPNIDSNQVKSQIQVMNEDFNALNTGTVPSSFTAAVANTGIHFCRAKFNPQGTGLSEPGIDRVSAASNGWLSPATASLNLQNYFNTVIIPATIWDPTKYLNIWVSDRPAASNMNGFATYPSGTILGGLFGGNLGSSTNDGIWIYGKAFGTVGTVNAPYNKGRTAVHELGHWLGLRHIWGDGNCLSDYCNDTPTAKQAHYGCPTTNPIDQCGVNQAPFGEMYMNFMDMTDDICRSIFTNDQNARMQTAMSMCGNRNVLGGHSLCTATPVPVSSSSAIASFAMGTVQCLNGPFSPFNTSSGFPYPTYVWSSSPAASFSPAATVANPAILLTNPGTYTITLVATNSVSSSSYSMIISATATCPVLSGCLDSLKMVKSADTLRTYRAPNSNLTLGCQTGFTGYLVGTNCYKDKEFAQYFPASSYTSTPYPQVNSVIVLFDSIGTKAFNPGVQLKCKIYGGSSGSGPGAVIGQKSDSLDKIAKSPKVTSLTYLGKPNVNAVHANTLIATKIIPFKFDFATPVIVNSSAGFFAGIEAPLPNTSDSINIMSNTIFNTSIDSSAWYFAFNNSWKTYRFSRGHKIQLAIMPQITCSPIIGLNDYQKSLPANVNLMPNPNNGVFSLIFTLPARETIEISIFNSIGQQLTSDKLTDVTNSVIDIDMRDRPEGVYFAHITNGTEKVVKKIVIAR